MFCKPDGAPLNQDVVRRDVLYPTLDRLGIPLPKRGAGFHCFRHSAGSFVNQQTGDLKLAQRFLGHANIGTTADVYAHTFEKAERSAAEAVERAVFGELFAVVRDSANTNNNSAVQ